MLRPKSLFLVGALTGLALVAGGSDFARADVVENFGATTPSNFSSCSFVSGDEGFVCPSGATYTTTNNDVLTATGYSDGSGVFTTPANITWKPSITESPGPPANSFDESGLGQNNAAPFTTGTANKCDDDPLNGGSPTACEVGVGRSLEVTSSLNAITDISVGSVQENTTVSAEVFGLYASTSSGPLTSSDLLGTFSSAGGGTSVACSSVPGGSYDGSGVCTFNFSASKDYLAVGIVELTGLNSMPSDSLITAVSIVPAPPIGHGLPAVIAVGGLLFGVWAWDRSRKRRLLGAAIADAAA